MNRPEEPCRSLGGFQLFHGRDVEGLPSLRPRRERAGAPALRGPEARARFRADRRAGGREPEDESGEAGDGVRMRPHQPAVPGGGGQGQGPVIRGASFLGFS